MTQRDINLYDMTYCRHNRNDFQRLYIFKTVYLVLSDEFFHEKSTTVINIVAIVRLH